MEIQENILMIIYEYLVTYPETAGISEKVSLLMIGLLKCEFSGWNIELILRSLIEISIGDEIFIMVNN
jgi:hypothetical protein